MNRRLARRWRAWPLLFFLLVSFLGLPFGCDEEGRGTNSFRFLVLSDLHVRLPGHPDDLDYDSRANLDNLLHMINRINTEFADAAFVVVTGDLVGTLYSDNPADYLAGHENPAETLASIVSTLRIPIHFVLGNHDYLKGYDPNRGEGIPSRSCEKVEAVWRKVLGIEPYGSFVYRGVRFVLLNSARGPARETVCPFATRESGCTGSFDRRQLDWLETELARPEPCVLFLHHPIITDHNATVRWSLAGESFQVRAGDDFYRIIGLYRDKILGIFVGHGHMWARDLLQGRIPVYETGALGDGGGHRDNVHVVTVFQDGAALDVEIGNPAATYRSGY